MERTKNFVVGGAAGKKMCEKEAKKNLRKVVQVPKKDSYERINEYKEIEEGFLTSSN